MGSGLDGFPDGPKILAREPVFPQHLAHRGGRPSGVEVDEERLGHLHDAPGGS